MKYYVIDKLRKLTESERDSRSDAQRHIDNVKAMFGAEPNRYVIAEGAKERDRILKQLKG